MATKKTLNYTVKAVGPNYSTMSTKAAQPHTAHCCCKSCKARAARNQNLMK